MSAVVRRRIESAGERVWSYEDFRGLPAGAVAQALSRLNRSGAIERVTKGAYYRCRSTSRGKSRPDPAALHSLASSSKTVFPSGITAANLLGFTNKPLAKSEVATTARSLSPKLVGPRTVVYIRRPEVWATLTDSEAALLDFLRRGGAHCDLSPDQAISRVTALLSSPRTFERLVKAARTEPPRVRAILGAMGEHMGKPRRILVSLRVSLNPLSRFSFGVLNKLPTASAWQARSSC